MWTENTPQARVDSMVFPRMLAAAEVLWAPRRSASDEPIAPSAVGHFEEFLGRVRRHEQGHLTSRGVAFGHAFGSNGEGTTLVVHPVRSAVVWSSLGHYEDHEAALAFDGNLWSYFWSNSALQAGDTFTVEFGEDFGSRVRLKSVKAITGRAHIGVGAGGA